MRPLLTWILPAVATFATWWVFLGTDANDNYAVAQVAGMAVVLLAIAVACGWFATRMDLLAVIVSGVVGVSAACWASWSDDDTGLFVIGWFMVTVGTLIVATAVVTVTWAVRERSRSRRETPPV